MTAPKYVRVEQEGDSLVVSPLFTFGSFAESELQDEWQRLQKQIDGPGLRSYLAIRHGIPVGVA